MDDKQKAIEEARLLRVAHEEKLASDPQLQEIVLLRTKLEVRTWMLRVIIAIAVAEAVIIFNFLH